MYVRPSGLITLTTDYGLQDPYVGILRGRLLAASDKPCLIDLSHDVAPGDLQAGAFLLWLASTNFPPGTVHLGCVGGASQGADRILAVSADQHYWLVADDGLCGAVLGAAGDVEIRLVDRERLRIKPSLQGDGRGLMATVAAWLASGRYGFSAIGPRVDRVDRTDHVFAGGPRVVYVDRRGTLVTNVRADASWRGRTIGVGEHQLVIGDLGRDPKDEPLLAYVGSLGLLEVAIRRGDEVMTRSLQRGAPIAVPSA